MFSKTGFYTFIYGTRVGDAKAPPFLTYRSSNLFITITIALAVFTDIFLYSMVVPVLPFALTLRAGIEEKDVQKWTSTFLSVYGAALAIGSPVFGYFADRYSQRRLPLLLGLFALGGATGMLCAGSSLALLLVGRFFQGLSASVVWTVGLALLSDTVPKQTMGKAMGYVAAATSVGSLAGPLLGGVVYQSAGYYAVFAMGFAIIGLDIILRLTLIEKSVAQQWDPPVEEATTSVETPEGNKEIQSTDDIQPQPQSNNFSDPEKHVSDATIDPSKQKWTDRLPPVITLLRVPRILVALLGCFVQSNSLGAFDSVLPLYVKDTFHWTSSGAGLIFIFLVIPALFSPLVGIISDKFGSRTITTVGLLGALPFWVCMRFVDHDSIGQKILLCAMLFGIGLCLTFIMAPLMADLDHAVELEGKKHPARFGKRGAAAQGFGLFNFAYAIGSLIGPIWAGFVVQDAGWATMSWSFGLLNGVCAVATFCFTGGRIMLKGKEGRRQEGGGMSLGKDRERVDVV